MKRNFIFLAAGVIWYCGFTFSSPPFISLALAQDEINTKETVRYSVVVRYATYIYSEPDTSSTVAGRTMDNEALDVLDSQNPWFKIRTASGIVGWIPVQKTNRALTATVRPEQPSKIHRPPANGAENAQSGQRLYAKHEVTVYTAPAFDAPRIGRFPQDTVFHLLAVENRYWYKIDTPDGDTGYVSRFWVIADTQTKPFAGERPIDDKAEKSGLKAGEIMESTVSDGRPDQSGSSASKLRSVSMPQKVYAKHDVTIYTTPAFDADRIGRFGLGAGFEVLEVQNGFWYKVRTPENTIGYISRFWVSTDPKIAAIVAAKNKQDTAQKKAQIVALEAEVKPIPASNVAENLRIYRKLLELDPQNRFYQSKVAHYRRKWVRHQKTLRAKSRLELVDWHWQKVGDLAIVEGQVQNISKSTLAFPAVVVNWHDRQGRTLTSARTFLDIESLRPGEFSSFKLGTHHLPAMHDATISFIVVSKKLSTYSPDRRFLKLAEPAAE